LAIGSTELLRLTRPGIGLIAPFYSTTVVSAMYTKLPNSSSFRLLYLAPGQAEDVINVILLVVDNPDEAPEFEALSYVWGTPKDPVLILCDDEVTSVSRNLAGATSTNYFKVVFPRNTKLHALIGCAAAD
jgi:hypothetical protein